MRTDPDGAANHSGASMRPGFYIPECAGTSARRTCRGRRFNEAGILHPGMRWITTTARPSSSCFNEAGILHPGMRSEGPSLAGVNEASMRPGFYIPECCASMHRVTPRLRGFNEAGILHPGMPRARRPSRVPTPRFNEAGILHPGMHHQPGLIGYGIAGLQ